jgi:hypothetical protein
MKVENFINNQAKIIEDGVKEGFGDNIADMDNLFLMKSCKIRVSDINNDNDKTLDNTFY